MTADDRMKSLCIWAVFKIQGFVGKRFLPFFPSPSPFFYSLHFRAAILCSRTSKKRLLPSLTETLATQATRGPNAKNSFAWPEFRSLRTGTLATQARHDSATHPFNMFLHIFMCVYMSGFMKTVLITTTTAWDFSKIIHRLFTQ